MLSDCKTLEDYLQAYGGHLGARATDALAPLHVPGRDPIDPAMKPVDDHIHVARRSRVFDAQAHLITALAKRWRTAKSAFLNGRMGSGKSLMGAAVCHVHAARKGRGYRAMIMCPDHLINKWGREIRDTCPGATVRSFKDWKEVLAYCEALPRGRPSKAEWLIIGRDQSKFDPAWRPAYWRARHPIDNAGRVLELGGSLDDATIPVAKCPRCGAQVADKDKNPIRADDLPPKRKLTCQAKRRAWVGEPGAAEEVELDEVCGEPLWQFTRKPYRWAPARIVHRKLKRRIDYLILDEVHELKGDAGVAQANAAGKLIAASKKRLALTGTLIGGRADHLFPLLMRLAPRSLLDMGIGWGDQMKFNQLYGRIETTVHTRSGKGEGDDNSHSMGRSNRRTTQDIKPGVMPQFFGDHLIDKAVFLELEDIVEGLPDLYETIVPVTMDAELAHHYREMEDALRAEMRSMLARGDKRLLGTMLMSLLAYPDHPFDWSSIGYREGDQWIPVHHPKNLDPGVIRPKERALVDLVKAEQAQGRKVWIYVQFTQTRDVGDRLVRILGDAGVRAGYMRSSVDRRKREDWIYKEAPKLDACICHPKLVETGLDLFAKDGNHNFPTLVFYETGYNLFTIRQAGRRSWRIGQPLPCRTVFMYYAGTMQEGAMNLMGRKMSYSEALEGKFSEEGLAAMNDDGDATMALAKALAEKVDVRDDRSWSKNLGFGGDAPAVIPMPSPPAPAAPAPDDIASVAAALLAALRAHEAPMPDLRVVND